MFVPLTPVTRISRASLSSSATTVATAALKLLSAPLSVIKLPTSAVLLLLSRRIPPLIIHQAAWLFVLLYALTLMLKLQAV